MNMHIKRKDLKYWIKETDGLLNKCSSDDYLSKKHTLDFMGNQLDKLIEWFKKFFDVQPKVLYAKQYPFLKFNQKDSLKLWKQLREVILGIKSMRHKFRYMETTFQLRSEQCAPQETLG